MPADGYISRGYEPELGHYGIDLIGRVGSPIKAAAEGHVVFAGWTPEDGNTIILSHAGGFLSFYKHNHTLLKTAGVFVRRGEQIATLGNTGETSLGPHVHFEVWKDGSPKDPSHYLLNQAS
jgi:murein DD-endopeptidase MepM/ murein hydrolase activator NlpD